MTGRITRWAAAFLALLGAAPAGQAASVWFDTPLVVSGSGSIDAGIYLDGYQIPDNNTGLQLQVDFVTNAEPDLVSLTVSDAVPADNAHVNTAQYGWSFSGGDLLAILLVMYSSDPGPFVDTRLATLTFDYEVSEPSFLTFAVDPGATDTEFTATAELTPVPVPPALWLFAGALAVTALLRRRA